MAENYTFTISSIEELITAASIMDDNDKAFITGTQLKEAAIQVKGLKHDLMKCHEFCDELGIPDLGEGVYGLMKRLEFLKDKKDP